MARETIRVIAALDEVTERLMTFLSVEITANLINDTPVDTGWARANWVPSIGSRNNTPASAEARVENVPAQRATQQSSIAGLTNYRIESGSVFISNNVPYIVRLNEGSSTQAPQGFVQGGIQRGIIAAQGRFR